MTIRATKPWTGVHEQMRNLHTLGLDIQWEQTRHWLQAVGYYRLSGYWHPFRVRFPSAAANGKVIVSSAFVAGASMKNVAALYEFDRKLKAHLLSGLERVEIACRSRMADVLGARSVNALMEPEHFQNSSSHEELMLTVEKRIQRALDSSDPVALHHAATYGGDFPIWAAVEFLDFGDVSRLYANLHQADRETVAEWFGWKPTKRYPDAKMGAPLMNWLQHLTVVRNTAAHHARLWNRTFTPTSPKKLPMVPGLEKLRGQQDKIYGTMVVLGQLVKVTSPGTTWHMRLQELLQESFGPIDGVRWEDMGFPPDWKNLPPFVDPEE